MEDYFFHRVQGGFQLPVLPASNYGFDSRWIHLDIDFFIVNILEYMSRLISTGGSGGNLFLAPP